VSVTIQVECYAGYRGEQTPRRITFARRSVEVLELLDCWLAPDHRYFKFIGADGALYIIRHDTGKDVWELTLYDATRPAGGIC
jgi:hypothetical protein